VSESREVPAEEIEALERVAMPVGEITMTPRGVLLFRARRQFAIEETVVAVPVEMLVPIIADASAQALATLRRLAKQGPLSS
jgi:hypothetical protein